MNGEINGMMDESTDTIVPNSPDNLQNQKNDSSEGCDNPVNHCENSSNTENSDHLEQENELNQDPLSNSNADNSENDSSNDIDGDPETVTEVLENENSNNIFLDNDCVNSNESYANSVTSSQAKSETLEQHVEHIDEKSKDVGLEKEFSKQGNIENSEDDVDSVEDSSDDEGSEGEPRAGDTVSINSDSDPQGGEETSQESHMENKNHDLIVLENERTHSQNGNSHDSPSPEIHEIVSDDNDECIIAVDTEEINDSCNKVQLRRSSRAIKRKRYNDDMENGDNLSELEEFATNTPHNRKSKPIVISDTKALVEMAARQMKHNNNQKKEPTVVIIDTNSITSNKVASSKHTSTSTNTSMSAHNLYQSIVARGTTVTPVSSKSSVSTQSTPQIQQPAILPSLTDDMFVVEAPSFIVPYVYEKPSVKQFREFVDLLGKELDEQKAKADKELLEIKNKEKENETKESQEKKEKGEDAQDSEEEASVPPVSETSGNTEVENAEEKKKKKRDKQKRRNDDEDDSWDGESSTDSDDELLSEDENKTIIIKNKVDTIDEIKDVTELTVDKVCSTKSDNYFDCSLGKFFINIGLSLVQEYVQTDLVKQQNRKLNREKKTGHNTKATETSIASLMKNLEFSKENNAPYSFKQKKCEHCTFKSESMLAMAHHLETPHMKNNVYKCNFCTFEIRSPHDILYHMEAEHNVRGKLERAPAYHQCANCPFEDNGKGKLARHLIPCAKKFKPALNLAPPLEWEPPAKIPKITRSRNNNMMGSYQNAFNRSHMGNNSMVRGGPMTVTGIVPGLSSGYRPRGRSIPTRVAPVHSAPNIRGNIMVRHNAPVLVPSNYPLANNKPKSGHQPSISITPLPRQPQPVVHPAPTPHNKSTFVICEICDGYIKDLEQLRNHMQWIHKVKIHPKMIYNRPPLNCQKCQFRFFTDQGLERHLLGSHGLVTSSMQEAANKGKDAGRCPVCGRVYQWKLLNHVARDHSLTLKPAHLSYKCTVCTATFGMYKQFENHVYSAHSVVAKRVMDKSKTTGPSTKSSNDSLLKPLKINDEITIIPQPVKSVASASKDK